MKGEKKNAKSLIPSESHKIKNRLIKINQACCNQTCINGLNVEIVMRFSTQCQSFIVIIYNLHTNRTRSLCFFFIFLNDEIKSVRVCRPSIRFIVNIILLSIQFICILIIHSHSIEIWCALKKRISVNSFFTCYNLQI